MTWALIAIACPKPRKFQKRLECELLLDDAERLAKKGEITIEPTFKQEVVAEAGKTRGRYKSSIIDPRHQDAAKQLKADHNITIRKADNAATYVIMDTSKYLQKIDDILDEATKFKRITRDPTEDLKKKVNKLIVKNDIASKSIKLEKLSGEFTMAYCFMGCVEEEILKKTDKPDIY